MENWQYDIQGQVIPKEETKPTIFKDSNSKYLESECNPSGSGGNWIQASAPSIVDVSRYDPKSYGVVMDPFNSAIAANAAALKDMGVIVNPVSETAPISILNVAPAR